MSTRHYMAGKVGARVSLKAKYELYRNILQQEVGFFDETKSGRFLGGPVYPLPPQKLFWLRQNVMVVDLFICTFEH